MSETFESLFSIGVQTQEGITALDQLLAKLKEADTKFAESIKIAQNFGVGFGTSIQTGLIAPLDAANASASTLAATLSRLNISGTSVGPAYVRGGEEAGIPAFVRQQQAGYDPRAGSYRSMTGTFATQQAAFGELAESGVAFKDIAKLADTELAKIPVGAQKSAHLTYEEYKRLKHQLVGDPLFGDIATEANAYLAQIHVPPELWAELDLVAQRVQNLYSLPLGYGESTAGTKVPQYVRGQISGYDPSIGGRTRSAVTGRFILPQEAQQEAYWEQVATEEFLRQQAEMMPPEYGATGPTPAIPFPTITRAERPTEETYVNGELTQRVERYTETVNRFNKAGEVRLSVVRDTTKAMNAEGETIKKVTHETENNVAAGTQVNRTFTEMGEATGKAEKGVALLGSRFVRHLTWIAQGMLIWQGIRLIGSLKDAFLQNFSEMEQAAARTAFILDSTTQQIMASQLQAAGAVSKYGIQPTAVAGAGVVAAQYGVPQAAVIEDASRLAMVAQMDLAEATGYLLSIERTWNISLDETSRVLDTLVTMYATAPGTMKEFMDMMREGPSLALQMGLSFEEYMLMIARAMSYIPSQTASGMSGLLGRTVTRLTTGDIPEQLAKRYDIGVIDPKTLTPRPGIEVLDEIAAKYRSLATEQERTALAILVSGTRQGQAWQDAKVLLDNWGTGIRGAETAMRDFDQVSQGVMETQNTSVQSMKAEWTLLIQEIGRATGAAETYRDVVIGLRNFFMGMRISQEYGGPSPSNRTPGFVGDYYIKEPAGGSAKEPAGGYGDYGEQSRSWMWRDAVKQSGDEFNQRVKDAAEKFGQTANDVTSKLALLTSMLYAGWSPSPSVVDLTGTKENPYTMQQVNKAIQQSRADTDRMIASYRAYLQQSGLGGDAITTAMQNFTEKLMLQLQFFRLPGGEIRLMEGRDLLYYLGKIEENTRPLEGIWNVPEGMRVWVPIESTFYGNWRKQQEEAGAGGGMELDASQFDGAVNKFGMSADQIQAAASLFGKYGIETPQRVVEAAGNLMTNVSSWIEKLFGFKSVATTQQPAQSAPPDVRDTWGWKWRNVDEQPSVRDTQGWQWRNVDQPAPAATGWDMFLEQFNRNLDNLFHFFNPETKPESKLEIPQPLGVTMPQNLISQGVQVGTVSTGMPISMSSMAGSILALRTLAGSQITWLMAIARNTATPPSVTLNVTQTPGATQATTVTDNLFREWLITHGVYEVPT